MRDFRKRKGKNTLREKFRMNILRKISENEMISEFLRAEISSTRFGKKILQELSKINQPKSLILKPDLDNNKENVFRKKIISEFRGYGETKREKKLIFHNIPLDIKWYLVELTKKEFSKVKYIDDDYWRELSKGTRLPAKAASNLKSNRKAYGVSNKIFFNILNKIKNGEKFPLMIFVAKNRKSKIVILEGHARLTAYFLEPKYISNKINAIMGISSKIINWGLY